MPTDKTEGEFKRIPALILDDYVWIEVGDSHDVHILCSPEGVAIAEIENTIPEGFYKTQGKYLGTSVRFCCKEAAFRYVEQRELEKRLQSMTMSEHIKEIWKEYRNRGRL